MSTQSLFRQDRFLFILLFLGIFSVFVPLREIFTSIIISYILFALAICIRKITSCLPWLLCYTIALILTAVFFIWFIKYIFTRLLVLFDPPHSIYEKIFSNTSPQMKDMVKQKFKLFLGLTELNNFTSFIPLLFSSILQIPSSILRLFIQFFLCVLFLFKLNKTDEYLSTEDNSENFSIYRVISNIHTNLKKWLVAAITMAFVNSLFYLAFFISFEVQPTIATAILYGFSGLIPFLGDFIAWSFGLFAIYDSNVENTLYCLTSLGILFFTTSFLTPFFVSNKLKIPFIFILLGMLVHSYLFGGIGIIFNLPLCIITKAVLTESLHCIKKNI